MINDYPDIPGSFSSAVNLLFAAGVIVVALMIHLLHSMRKMRISLDLYKRNAEKYRKIIDDSLDVFYRSDAEGNIIMMSNSFKNILEYNSVEECIGMNIARDLYYNPSDRDIFMNILREHGSVTDYETTLRRKDSSPVIVSTSSQIYFDSDGKPAGVEGIVRDITERKRAEDMFNKAFHENPCPMSISAIETGFYIEVNKAWLNVLEFKKEDVIGRTAFDIKIYSNPEDRNRVVEAIKTAGKISGLEIDFVTSTGDIRTGLFFGEIIIVEGRKMLLSAVLDISEQRKAEKALLASEERFRRLAENAPDMIYRMSLPDGLYEYVNPVTERITGFKPEEIYQRPMFLADSIHPGWRDYFRDEWEKLIKGVATPTYEYKFITRDGTEKWLHQRNVLIKDEKGIPLAIEGIVTDVTERKYAEEELRLKNAILAAEHEVSIDGIIIVGLKGETLFLNRRFLEIWQIPAELLSGDRREEMLNFALTQIKDPGMFMDKVMYLHEHIDENSNDEIYFKDGRIIERYSAPVKENDGKYMGRVWYFRDITERKRAEKLLLTVNEELAASNEEFEAANEELVATNYELACAQKELSEKEKKYRTLVENLSVGLLLYNTEMRIVVSNPMASAILGAPKEQIEGRASLSPEWIIYRENGSLFTADELPLVKVISTGDPVTGMVIGLRHESGQKLTWLLCDAYPVKEYAGKLMQVIVSFIDITKRKHAEEEIQKLKNYLSNIIDSNPDILVGLDPELNITLMNRQGEKAAGISMQDAIGMPVHRVLEDFAPWIEKMKHEIKGRNTAEIPDLVLEKNGEKRYYDLALYPLISNGVEGAVVRIGNITDSKKKDEQLRQAQKMETVGTLAGGLAHDFNNVLSGIVGTVSLIKHIMDRDEMLNERFMKYIELIDKSGKRAAEMVQQLLTLSRRSEVTMKPLDLNNAVKNVIQICNNTFDKSIEIQTEYAGRDAVIDGDPAQIEQVILNLCINASHAMTIMRPQGEKHGGKLSITLRRILADSYFCSAHSEAHPGWYWLVSHGDTGVGIDDEIIRNIFDPFFSTKVKEQGTGLGLTMVYSIVHQHGGFIDVYSDRGTGSLFNVYFPEKSDAGVPESELSELSAVPGEGLILVIDDEEIVRFTAESILKECGYNVILADSGIEGLKIFMEFHETIKAVLLDMAMPGMSGKDVYTKMKKIAPGVKALLASGFRQDSRIDEALALGISGFIQKPYSVAELSRKINEIAGKK